MYPSAFPFWAAAKAAKEAKKAAQRAERERREKEKAERLAGVGATNFGDAKMVQSGPVTDKVWTEISDLKPALAGKEAGETVQTRIEPGDAYGDYDPQNVQVVDRGQFPPHVTPEVGGMLLGRNPKCSKFRYLIKGLIR